MIKGGGLKMNRINEVQECDARPNGLRPGGQQKIKRVTIADIIKNKIELKAISHYLITNN
jgi:hypothetical protein